MTRMPIIILATIAITLLPGWKCSETRTTSDTNTNRERTERREGYRQEYVDGVGIVNLTHGETVEEHETVKETTETMRVVTVPVAENLSAVARTFGKVGDLTTGLGIGGTLLTAGLAAWQRHKRTQAEQAAQRERALTDEAADLPPDEARTRVREKRGPA